MKTILFKKNLAVAVFIGLNHCMAEISDDPNYTGMLDIKHTWLKIYYSTVSAEGGANALSVYKSRVSGPGKAGHRG